MPPLKEVILANAPPRARRRLGREDRRIEDNDPRSTTHARNARTKQQRVVCFAVVLRQTEVLKLLLEGGADPNWATENGGAPPLYLAVLIGKKDLVELLLNGGAKPNIAVPLLQTRMAGGLTANEMDIFEMLADACANN